MHYSWLLSLPGVLLILLVAQYIEAEKPRLSLVVQTFSTMFVITIAIEFLTMAVQLTPMPLYDHAFARFDAMLGINVAAIKQWMVAHQPLYRLFVWIYESLNVQLILGPLLLALLLQRRSLQVFFVAILISTLVGFTIYYVIPTTDPAAIYKSTHFLPGEYAIINRYAEIHQHRPAYGCLGGLIGFPSFHVIWACCTAYAYRRVKSLSLPMLVWSALIIFSTMAVGWHFFADVLGGLVIIAISIAAAEWCCSRKDKCNQQG